MVARTTTAPTILADPRIECDLFVNGHGDGSFIGLRMVRRSPARSTIKKQMAMRSRKAICSAYHQPLLTIHGPRNHLKAP